MLKTSTISTKNFFEKAIKKVLVTENRKKILYAIADAVANEYAKKGVVKLQFICTHNSRRSQLAQVWCFYAAQYFNLNIHAFSGGNEVTCFNRSTIKTLKKSGFYFHMSDFSHLNPMYEISFEGSKKILIAFSKLIDDASNPTKYMAITTCSEADKNCLYIPNASYRFHLPFEDPKRADGTLLQEEVYLEISSEIAGEIGFILNLVKNKIAII